MHRTPLKISAAALVGLLAASPALARSESPSATPTTTLLPGTIGSLVPDLSLPGGTTDTTTAPDGASGSGATATTTAAGTGGSATTMDHGSDASTDASAPMAEAGPDSPASELRSSLNALLQEHVYLAGAAISTAVKTGGNMEDPAVASAVATLDTNSVALSEAIGSVYGDEAAAQFLDMWRQHIGFFVDYTLGGATGDTAKQDAAKAALDQYRTDFSEFLATATGGQLDATAVSSDLQMHVDTLIVAVDAVLAGTPDVYTKLSEAAHHMDGTALALATAISAQDPETFAGDPAGPGAELRAGLTSLLQEHVFLAGLAINQAVADGGDLEAPATADAVAALDANTVKLSEAIGSVYGDEAAAQFLDMWRQHIGFFVDYTLGGATGDTAKQEAAVSALDQYRADFSEFLSTATGGELEAAATAEGLQVHVETLVVAVDAVLAGSPDVFPSLQAAAHHMPMVAQELAGAIAAQMPDQFGS